MKKVIVIQKSNFISCPPIISVVLILNELGYQVELITIQLTFEWKKELDRRGIKYYEIPDSSIFGKLGQIKSYVNFRRNVKALLKDKKQKGEQFLLWLESAHTVLALGSFVTNYLFILHILELHNEKKYQIRAISKVISDAAAVVMPEYNRAVFYQIWFKLSKRPFVLPNKPYFSLSNDNIKGLSEKYNNLLDIFNKSKVVLYQGHIGKGRDLTNYLKAVKELGDDFRFVVLGKDYGVVDQYKRILPSLIHINYIPAPDYLIFTRSAYIGVVSYVPDCLNNAFCAPNKIWECTNFGVPVIANDIPGLKYTIESSGAGVCVDDSDVNSIINGIIKVDKEHDLFSARARFFYESADNKTMISQIVKSCEK